MGGLAHGAGQLIGVDGACPLSVATVRKFVEKKICPMNRGRLPRADQQFLQLFGSHGIQVHEPLQRVPEGGEGQHAARVPGQAESRGHGSLWPRALAQAGRDGGDDRHEHGVTRALHDGPKRRNGHQVRWVGTAGNSEERMAG